jgi:lipopolysaccharide export system permease protein
MKKLLFQNFIRDALRNFILISMSVAFIVWVIQAVNFLDFVAEDGHGLKVYFAYSLLNLPKIIHRILPFAFFISLFYQIYKYEERNELLVFWTNGVRKIDFINTVLLYSVIITIFQIILGSYFSPGGQNKARQYLRESNVDFLPSLIKEGKFIDTVSGLTIFIGNKNLNGSYENIFLNDSRTLNDNQKKSQTIYAKNGRLINENKNRYFELFNGNIINNEGQKTTNITFKKIDFNLSQYESKTTKFSKVQEIDSITLYRCLKHHRNKNLDRFEENGLICDTNIVDNVQQEFFKRYYKPVYLPLLALICCLLIIKSKQNKSYQQHKIIIFFLCFTIIVISEIALRYASQNNTGMIFFFSFPFLFFMFTYIPLITKFKRVV